METINEWLNGAKDYNSGLAMLAKYSKNRILLQNLSRKSLPAKLEYELRKLVKSDIPDNEIRHIKLIMPSGEIDTLEIGGKPRVDPDDLPDYLKNLWEETAEKYRLARATHEQIKQMIDINQRAAHIELLDNYRIEIRENWKVIDTFIKEHNNPETPVNVDEKRVNANRKYLSDGKKVIAVLSGAVRAKKLEAMQRRINELLSAGEKFDIQNQKELEDLGLKFING